MIISNKTLELMRDCQLHNATGKEINDIIYNRHTPYHLDSYWQVFKQGVLDLQIQCKIQLRQPLFKKLFGFSLFKLKYLLQKT